ncbi:MAG TPA: zinc-binding dehydrogenase [Candidatus Brocadiia bacterium]|nr:zinc-binding dehydrogenase [Candidatus Brocadiia bacterium]
MRNPTVVFPQPRQVVVEDRPVPKPGPGELLIRTTRTLISTGTELTVLSGEFPPDSAWSRYGRFPMTPGYNNVGVVEALGQGVDASWTGRRAAAYGAHARYVTSPAAETRRLERDELPDEEAVFFTIAEIVMNGVRRGGVTWGEAAVVYGLGLLGQMAVRFCQLAGARPVIGVDVAESRLALLPRAPGVAGVNPKTQEPKTRILELTRGRGADVVFELTGNADLIPAEFAGLRRQGRFVLLSSPRKASTFDFHDLCNAPSYTIIGAHNNSHPPVETPGSPWTQLRHAELFFNLAASGEIRVRELITHRAAFHQAPELYQMLLKDRGQAMGVVLDWTAG